MSIDRDALVAILMEQWTAEPRETADRILALVRPVEGVTLTPEEARFLAADVRAWVAEHRPDPFNGARLALAARLEASS